MPVTFLRTPADYFGIQEAPAQPLFQQTRALAEPAVQNQLNFMDKVTQLRQQRPLARAQSMQNEYDTIFANADRLRMQQEAAKQAEQAVSALAGLTPEADDYVTQRQQIQQQFPSAMLDPRVQRIVDDNDRVFGARQSSLARQQQELQQRRAKLFGAGATPQQVEAAYQNPDAAAQLEYQLGKGGGDENPRLKMLKEAFGTAKSALEGTPEFIMTPDGKEIDNPAFKARSDAFQKYYDEYQRELDKSLFPQVEKATTAAANAPPPPPPMPPPLSKAAKPELDAAARARLANIPADQLPQAIEKERAKLGEAEEINKVWQSAKDKLESQLKKVLPDKDVGFGINPIEQFARQVLEGKTVVDPSVQMPLGVAAPPNGFVPGAVPIQRVILGKLGLNPGDVAITEPGEKRKSLFGLVGTQDVTYDEAIKAWANEFLNKRGLLSASPVAVEIPVETRSKALGNVMKAIETN